MPKPPPLIRCPACRYLWESAANEAPTQCPQCRRPLTDKPDESSDGFDFEKHPTQKVKAIPKPED